MRDIKIGVSIVAKTHMWTFIVIKVNNVVNDDLCVLQVTQSFHAITNKFSM